MNEDFNNKMNQYISKKLDTESNASKEKIWERLDINKVAPQPSQRLWKIISALLFLLLLLLSSLFLHIKKTSRDTSTPPVIKVDYLTQYNQVLAVNGELKRKNTQLKDSLLLLKNKLQLQENVKDESIIIKDRLIYVTDTLYIKSDPIVKYKDIVLRDTIYIQEMPNEDPIASIEPEIAKEDNKRRNTVLFDLRNQINNNVTTDTDTKRKTITFSLNTN